MQGRVQTMFGCDIRSLAAFRIGIGILLFVDSFVRYGAAEAFYSGEGFMNAALAQSLSPDGYSLNYLSDSVAFQRLVFLSLACSAFLLCIGCFTRTATFCCWVLLASVHVRNPAYIIGGDTLMRLLLFWSLFAPLGSAWSMDHRRRRSKDNAKDRESIAGGFVCSVGTACLLLQVCVMYVTAGLSKWNDPWLTGIAMDFILRQDCYARPLSGWLVQFPTLTSLMSYATLFIELVVPFLLFLPYKTAHLRLAGVAFFWAFHLGIALTMDVGKFTYVCMVAWLLFLPSIFWNRFQWAQLSRVSSRSLAVEGDPGLVRLKHAARRLVFGVLPALLFCYVIVWNFAGLYGWPGNTWMSHNPDVFYRFGNAVMLKQNFHLFGRPARANTTFLFSGQAASGEELDLVRGTLASETGPGASLPEAQAWKTLHWYLISFGGQTKLYDSLVEYHARNWNRTADGAHQVHEARLELFAEDMGPGIEAGSFIHLRNVAEWRDPTWDMDSDDRLKQQFEEMMNRMENGGLFPVGSD